MIEYEVDRPMALDTFLRRKQMQSWRIPVMIDCGAIKVFSEGRELPLKKGPKTHVDGGDKIRIEDPLSKQCQEALQQKVDTEARDYAWVPGTSPFDKAMGKLIEARPRTIRNRLLEAWLRPRSMLMACLAFVGGLCGTQLTISTVVSARS